MTMTAYILSVVTNTHEFGFFRNALETLRTWQRRGRARRELARFSERELHDIGISWSSIAEEVNKPFWKA
jgi:uncharacterized protein YjiS (DUF1127 family)